MIEKSCETCYNFHKITVAMCNWRGIRNNRRGAHSIDKSLAWAKGKDVDSLPLSV